MMISPSLGQTLVLIRSYPKDISGVQIPVLALLGLGKTVGSVGVWRRFRSISALTNKDWGEAWLLASFGAAALLW